MKKYRIILVTDIAFNALKTDFQAMSDSLAISFTRYVVESFKPVNWLKSANTYVIDEEDSGLLLEKIVTILPNGQEA